MEKTREYRDGFTVVTRPGGRVSDKLPFFCPHEKCGRLTDSLDDEHLRLHGVCAICYITLVEDRKEPLIDVEKYRARLRERGY